MRHLVIATFVLVTSFIAPSSALADVCTSAGPACTINTTNDGTCTANLTDGGYYCKSNATQPLITNPGGGPPQITNPGTGITLINPLKAQKLDQFLYDILDFVIQIGTIVVILMTVFVGYKFVVAQGKDSELVEARKALLYTIIGALILLGAKAISIGIQNTVKALTLGN